ncbi:MAG: alanine--tRNA ligase [Chlamydiota bacterium]|nr:alanine--tRNA ligase [Chlamydiota bacterium]
MTTSHETRQRFLQFFSQREHRCMPSASLLPHEDPTLLFTNAGMNPFKEDFLGTSGRNIQRAVSSQKCLRVGGKHNDLENVGHTSRHMTFFEMLGNFSFGDYFKEKAIEYAWEVSQSVFGFDPQRLWATVFTTDDLSFALWERFLPPSRILRLGEEENFWSMGPTGPCGPCSELLYDRGPAFGRASSPLDDPVGERYPEFWNLVFMESQRDAQGTLTPLPQPCVDTGAGLERVISFMTDAPSVFQTDTLRELIATIERISNISYRANAPDAAAPFHVIADHVRALSFAIGDGAEPSNTERGYVLRKMLRRSVRYGKMLGLHEPFLGHVATTLIENMGPVYPEIKEAESRILSLLEKEESSFLKTLKKGEGLFQRMAASSAGGILSGKEAFTLKDTYGIPWDEILLMANDLSLTIDRSGYEKEEERAKERSRAAATTLSSSPSDNDYQDYLSSYLPSQFLGREKDSLESKILAIFHEGKPVDILREGMSGEVILDMTPFYAEQGGQVGDRGILSYPGGHFDVQSCEYPLPGIISHRGRMKRGTLQVGETITAAIDQVNRHQVSAHHTATHLLHWALEKVLGEHIRQRGSLVTEERLRFDFSHHSPITQEEKRAIERLIQEAIWQDAALTTEEVPYEEVQRDRSIKQFFGDKYGDQVRLVTITGYSKELCGGTHLDRLGPIGYLVILKESSIGQGLRRIEAVIGREAEATRYHQEDLLLSLTERLGVKHIDKIPDALNGLIDQHRQCKEEISTLKQEGLKREMEVLLAKKEQVGSHEVIAAISSASPKDLLPLAQLLASHAPHSFIALASVINNQCPLILQRGGDHPANASALFKELSPLIGAKGGGNPQRAQGAGNLPEGLRALFTELKEQLR